MTNEYGGESYDHECASRDEGTPREPSQSAPAVTARASTPKNGSEADEQPCNNNY
jgi:hypothetical protein